MKYQTRKVKHLTDLQLLTQLRLGAAEFYQACLEGKIKREDCSPVHSVSNMYSKVSVLNKLLDLKNSKCYKIGEKDLVSKPEKIIFILQRKLDEEKYGKIFFEIKKGLLQEEYSLLPAQIRQRINPLVQLEKEVPS